MVSDCQVGDERLSRAYYSLITTVRTPISTRYALYLPLYLLKMINCSGVWLVLRRLVQEAEPAFKLHLLGAVTSFLVRWLIRVRDAAASAGTTAAARHGLQEQVCCWLCPEPFALVRASEQMTLTPELRVHSDVGSLPSAQSDWLSIATWSMLRPLATPMMRPRGSARI